MAIKLKRLLEDFHNKYEISNFTLGSLVHFKDGEVWIVVKSGMRGSDSRLQNDEVQLRPYNQLAKKNNTSIGVDFNLDYLNKNVVKIENSRK